MRFATEIALVDKELSRIKAEVAHADAAALSLASPVQERAAASRASAYVWLAAVLERVVRSSIQQALLEISAATPSLKDLRLSLFSLLCDGEFKSISDRAKSHSWAAKIAIFERTIATGAAILSGDVMPLDGKTIRGDHFDTIWLVFGMQSQSLPSPLHRIALKDLADGRNEVAHGHFDPVVFGRRKATRDLLRLIGQVDDVITHLLTSLDGYIDKKQYIHR